MSDTFLYCPECANSTEGEFSVVSYRCAKGHVFGRPTFHFGEPDWLMGRYGRCITVNGSSYVELCPQCYTHDFKTVAYVCWREGHLFEEPIRQYVEYSKVEEAK